MVNTSSSMTPNNLNNPREMAYLALLAALKEDSFISEYLDRWRKKENPATKDFNLAQEISYGACRMASALDYIAEQLAEKKKLSLKLKEKALLRLALYQLHYMSRLPRYAVANEMVRIANKYCYHTFCSFLNAILRKYDPEKILFPSGDTAEDLAILYSYPPYFVGQLISDYGLSATKEILTAGNTPAVTMLRLRKPRERIDSDYLKPMIQSPLPVFKVMDPTHLSTLALSADYYIQNITPILLMSYLKENFAFPNHILDLCASPGGKTILAHDFYPQAKLYANDISETKLLRLKENFAKYQIEATLSAYEGQNYPTERLFDLIIIDAPCSNSGVLNKRPEARWRLNPTTIKSLETTQKALLAHASRLLSPTGQIWYLTCSILKEENEQLVHTMAKQMNLQVIKEKTFLPTIEGQDGGFGAALIYSHRV